jgi:hypothetical protein
MAVVDIVETFEVRLPLDMFDYAEWNRQQWVEMFLMICVSEIWVVRNKGRRGHKQPAMYLGERRSKQVRSNLPKLPNTTFMVVIRWVMNGMDMVLAPKQLQALYTKVRHWEELIDFIDKNGGPKKSYIMTSMFTRTLEQDELDEEYMGIYTNGEMIVDPISDQILYTCCLSKAFQLKLGQNPEIFLSK